VVLVTAGHPVGEVAAETSPELASSTTGRCRQRFSETIAIASLIVAQRDDHRVAGHHLGDAVAAGRASGRPPG